VIAGWLADQAGVERSTAQCGTVTLIQRFGSAQLEHPLSYAHSYKL